MAAIRVFLLTYRRPHLLRRALASLRAQTFRDWICELHNDDPTDDNPRQLLAEIADPRFTLHQHASNWGPVATFNHAYAAGPEAFASILEDDNWWEPEFLITAHAVLLATPHANVVWANLRIWQEQADGTWQDTARTIWATAPAEPCPRLFYWPQPLQFSDGLHSNGAMLYRAAASASALVPANTPFAIIEPTRERLLAGAWLLLPQVLAHFAVTLRTSRSPDRALWSQSQLLVAASYLAAIPASADELAGHWHHLRGQRPSGTNLLFQLALAGIRTRDLLSHARPADWLRFLAGAVRHPLLLRNALRFRFAHPEVWAKLRDGAIARSRENLAASPNPAIWEKRLLP